MEGVRVGVSPLSRHQKFLKRFHNTIKDTPVDYPPLVIDGGTPIVRWLQSNEFPDCFLAIGEGEVLIGAFYCKKCHLWLQINMTRHHIEDHFQTRVHSDISVEQVSRLKSLDYCAEMVRFFIHNGLSFKLIEDPSLSEILHGLPKRKDLSRLIGRAADLARERIKGQCSELARCVITFDAWSDRSSRRFLGLTVSGFCSERTVKYCLGVHDVSGALTGDHLTGDGVGDIVYDMMEYYSVTQKVIALVTDRGADMKAGVRQFQKRAARNVIHGNCVCHAVNTMLGNLVALLKPQMETILSLRQDLTGLVFSSFLRRRHAKYTVIPSYIPIRWYSLFKMLKVMFKLREEIIDFCESEGKDIPDPGIFDMIGELLPTIGIFKTLTKTLESENFGTIGLVLPSFRKIIAEVRSLSEKSQVFSSVFREWLPPVEKLITKTKKNWCGLLESATILHPGVAHQEILTHGEMELASNNIRAVMRFYGWNGMVRDTNEYMNTNADSQGQRLHRDNESNTLQLLGMPAYAPEKDELARYYNLKSGGTKALEFWENRTDMPALRKAACDVLSIVPSSAGSERTFSAAGRIEGIRRLSMATSKLEDSVLLMMNPRDLISTSDIKRMLASNSD